VSAKNNGVITIHDEDGTSSSVASLDLRRTAFLSGAARAKQFPPDDGWEVAVAGRSNAGKSSAINVITGVRGLARVSKTPGRTREINFFKVDSRRRLVDLPGYGYARVPVSVRQAWQRLIESYFTQRHCLRGVVVVMDCRHPLTDFDQLMLQWCSHARLPVHLLLTKADKLSRGAAAAVLHKVRGRLAQEFPSADISTQLFSALKRTGLAQAREILAQWMDI